jgi:hypothetical protein
MDIVTGVLFFIFGLPIVIGLAFGVINLFIIGFVWVGSKIFSKE